MRLCNRWCAPCGAAAVQAAAPQSVTKPGRSCLHDRPNSCLFDGPDGTLPWWQIQITKKLCTRLVGESALLRDKTTLAGEIRPWSPLLPAACTFCLFLARVLPVAIGDPCSSSAINPPPLMARHHILCFFGDTVSHLPGCCFYYALVSDVEGPCLNRSCLCGVSFPYLTDICPAVASHPATSDPEREHPLITPPDITVQRCSSGPVVWGPK